MAKQSIQDVFQALAEKHDLVHPDGTINRSEFSRATGIPAPTISRIIRGKEDWSITADTAEALMRGFNITFEQARGDRPIPRYKNTTAKPIKPTAPELELIRDLRTLPPEVRARIERYIADSVVLWRDELGQSISRQRKAALSRPLYGGRPPQRRRRSGS